MSKEYWKPGNMLYPVPAVMVSCGREGETPNIITVAWAGTICSDPAMVSISVRKERFSHSIIRDTGEFVINLVNKRLVRATDYCGVKSGRDVDKFKETRLNPQASRYVKAPHCLSRVLLPPEGHPRMWESVPEGWEHVPPRSVIPCSHRG